MGEIADAMYFVSAGKVRIDELNVEIGKGSLFGEIGIFSVDRLRTATARLGRSPTAETPASTGTSGRSSLCSHTGRPHCRQRRGHPASICHNR
jgi:hypothetical protein